ncbi:hypothetical protein [Vaginisenegalia massiliensis]|uniref:hypothetical protein n=1 Tax=Vaginisenegalia massiliensis TaxID=2058294 RepID=UPI000F52E160|nr:hypothetical protein [Vaginisenegalia massiliensis]
MCMKKTMKWISSVLVAFMLVLSVLPTAQAAANVQDVIKKISQANQNADSGLFKGNITITSEDKGNKEEIGTVDGEFQFDLKAAPMLALKGNLASQMAGSKPIALEAYIKDNKAAFKMNDQWQQADVTQYVNDFKKQYDEAKAQYKEPTKEQLALQEKYMDFKEEGNEYIFTLKKDIKAEELYADLDKAYDFEAMKTKSLEQAKEQAKTQGQEMTPEMEAEMKKAFDKMYSPETLALFLKNNPVIETHYDKKTNQLTKMVADITLPLKEMIAAGQPETTTAAESDASGASLNAANDAPEKLNIKLDFTFSGLGEAQDVQVPEEAQKAPEAGAESSSEASSN